MSDVRVALEFFENYLHKNLKSIIDLSILQLQSASFIDKELQLTETDLLYRTQFCFDKTELGYLYLLVEHQTNPDYWLPLRLLRYLCNILDKHRQQYPDAKELPLVVPLIFYTGKGLFSYSTDFFELFGKHQELARDLMLKPYHLVQLHKYRI